MTVSPSSIVVTRISVPGELAGASFPRNQPGAYCRGIHRLTSPLFRSRSGHKIGYDRTVPPRSCVILNRDSVALAGAFRCGEAGGASVTPVDDRSHLDRLAGCVGWRSMSVPGPPLRDERDWPTSRRDRGATARSSAGRYGRWRRSVGCPWGRPGRSSGRFRSR